MPGTPTLWRQRQTDLCGFQGVLGLYSVTRSERRWGSGFHQVAHRIPSDLVPQPLQTGDRDLICLLGISLNKRGS